MSLKKNYGRTVRKQLSHFPTWDPCAAVELGDYGEIRENCFFRLGSLQHDFGFEVKTKGGKPHAWQFESAGSRVARINAEAEGRVDPTTKASGTLMLSFDDAYSLYLRSAQSTWEEVTNVSDLYAFVRQLRRTPASSTRTWQGGYVIVSARRVASPLTLFMNTSTKSSIAISGAASILDDVDAGRLTASGALQITGDAGLKVVGAQGPVLLDLVRVSLFRSGPAVLEGADAGLRLDPLQGIE